MSFAMILDSFALIQVLLVVFVRCATIQVLNVACSAVLRCAISQVLLMISERCTLSPERGAASCPLHSL